jgi:hypothetical protein
MSGSTTAILMCVPFPFPPSPRPPVPPSSIPVAPLVSGFWSFVSDLPCLAVQTSMSQIEHLLQTAEAIRRAGKPEVRTPAPPSPPNLTSPPLPPPQWMQLVGLVHDLGKLLHLFGSAGQWDVVGDTFVVGAAFSDKNIYPDTFAANPDARDPVYATQNGVYAPGCGLDNVLLSWGHDEYMYTIAKEQSSLPPAALAMIRYHSFYPCVPPPSLFFPRPLEPRT